MSGPGSSHVDGGADGDRPPVVDVYARLSRMVDGTTIKTDDQIEMGREIVEERGARVGEVFRDDSASAWNPKVVRKDWNRLMSRLESGESDGVWVYDATRFTRKILEGEKLVELASQGIMVWSSTGEYDLTTADGRRHFREDMVAAAGESDKMSERIRRGKLRRAKKGRLSSPGAAGYGHPRMVPKSQLPADWEPGDPRPWIPDEQVERERDLIRSSYRDLLTAGRKVAEVLRDLNAKGVPGPTGGRWTRPSYHHVLTRPNVAGLAAFNGEIIGTLTGVEPIVTREEWERMCAYFASRPRGRPAGVQHPLARTMRCGICGMWMSGTLRMSAPPYPDGSRYREYRCSRNGRAHGPKPCGGNPIDARVVEAAVETAVKAALGDPRRAERMSQRITQTRKRRAKLEAERDRLDHDANNLALKTAKWGEQRVDLAMEPILERINEINEELARLDEPEDIGAAIEDVTRTWDEAMVNKDYDTIRTMTRRAFLQLTIKPATKRGDYSTERIDWYGETLPATPGVKATPQNDAPQKDATVEGDVPASSAPVARETE